MKKFSLLSVALAFVLFSGVAHAETALDGLEGEDLTPGQRAAIEAMMVEPKVDMPDALITRQLMSTRRVNTVGAWAKVSNVGGTTAVYFTLRGGSNDDRLLSVNTPWAAKAEMHDTTVDENGVVSMKPIKTLLVSTQSELAFSPGGRHIMLMGLKRELRRGNMFPVNLVFEKAGVVRAMVEVRGPTPAERLRQSNAPKQEELAPAPDEGVAAGEQHKH